MKPGLYGANIAAVYMVGTNPGVETEEFQRGMSKDPIAIHPAALNPKLLPMVSP